jgi:integrase
VDWGWLPKRPKVVLLAEPPARVRWLTDAERLSLAAELGLPQRKAFRLLCSAALLSGARLGKVIALLKTDVDLDRRLITIHDMAKGGKRKTIHVPVSDALAEVLTEAMASAGDDCPYVFPAGRRTRGQKKPYTQSGVSSFFAKVAEGAGISDFHFHDLRHDFATTLTRGGVGLNVLQKLLGHSTSAMTQRYAHLADTQLAAAAGVARPLPVAPPAEARKAKKKARPSAAQRAS